MSQAFLGVRFMQNRPEEWISSWLPAMKTWSQRVELSPIYCLEAEQKTKEWREFFLVIRCETEASADFILQWLKKLEAETPEVLKASIYLLSYDQRMTMTPMVVLPHPKLITVRPFLVGAAELNREWEHPVLQQTLAKYEQGLSSRQDVYYFGRVPIGKGV